MRGAHINDGWLDTTSTRDRVILDFRGEGMGPLLTLGRYAYNAAAAPLGDQQHDDWLVLVFALDGAHHYQVGDTRLLLRAGEFLRVIPGTRYGSGPWPEQRGTVAWMILKADPGSEAQPSGIQREVAREVFLRLVDPQAPVILAQPPLAAALIGDLFACWETRAEPLCRERIHHRLATLLLDLASTIAQAGALDSRQPGYPAARIRHVLSWLAAHVRDEIRIGDLAARSRLPQARFFREFKALTGLTPKDYVLRLKIEEAVRMLESNPDLSVTAIAHGLGFSSSQYFATVFRRYMRVSPGELRQQRQRLR
jgi:AraC-like DNA-binding protein